MDIQDAFTPEAIDAAGTNVSDEEEQQVAAMARRVLSEGQISHNQEIVNICLLMFVAGRTHQSDRLRIPIYMSPGLISQFLEFLTTP